MPEIELTRRRVLGGLITVGAASAAAGAGTFAYFSDTSSSNNNTIEAGTLDIGNTSNGEISMTNVAPGDPIPSSGGTTTIQATYLNSSSINSAEVDIDIALSEPSETSEPSFSTELTAPEFASKLIVDTAAVTLNGTSQTDLMNTQGVSNVADLDELSIDPAVGGVSSGDTVGLELGATFDEDAENDYQADGVTIDVTFTAEQSSKD